MPSGELQQLPQTKIPISPVSPGRPRLGQNLFLLFDHRSILNALLQKVQPKSPVNSLINITQLIMDSKIPPTIRGEAMTAMYRAIVQAGVWVSPELDPEEVALAYTQVLKTENENNNPLKANTVPKDRPDTKGALPLETLQELEKQLEVLRLEFERLDTATEAGNERSQQIIAQYDDLSDRVWQIEKKLWETSTASNSNSSGIQPETEERLRAYTASENRGARVIAEIKTGMLEGSQLITGQDNCLPAEAADVQLVNNIAAVIAEKGFMTSSFDRDPKTPYKQPLKPHGFFSRGTPNMRDPRVKKDSWVDVCSPDYEVWGIHDSMIQAEADSIQVAPYKPSAKLYEIYASHLDPARLAELKRLADSNAAVFKYETITQVRTAHHADGSPYEEKVTSEFECIIPTAEAIILLSKIKASTQIMKLLIKQFYPDVKFPPDSNFPGIEPALNLILIDDFTRPINQNSWRYKLYQDTFGAGKMGS